MTAPLLALAVALALPLAVPLSAAACDVCAVYTATEMRESRRGPWLGLAEQFTHFGQLQVGGDDAPNTANERLDSSITQFVLGYTLDPRFSLLVNLPFLHRDFRRLTEDGLRSGTESGIGDLAFILQWKAWSHVSEESVIRLSVFAGVEVPTGNSDRLGEELEAHHEEAEHDEEHHEEAAHHDAHHDEHGHGDEHDEADGHGASGVHGHDLALGSGSVDGLFGAKLFASRQKLFWTSQLQYGLRTKGDKRYSYADEISWSGGPGVFLGLEHNYTFGLQALFSGETKSKDKQAGVRLDDSAITAVYGGPAMVLTWGSSFAAEVGGELPIVQNSTATQIVPSYRIRGGLTWRFL